MSQAKKVEAPSDSAPQGREWSTAYMAVAFGLGLAVGFLAGGLYGAYWGERNAPLVQATEESASDERAADEHAGHDHNRHDHDAHDHAGHEEQ